MTETTDEISRQEASRWFYRLRTHPDLQTLVEKSDDFDVTVTDLIDEEVRVSESGERVVFLRLQEDEVTNYIASGIFEADKSPDEAELVELYIEESVMYSPLAGHGTRWTFDEGEVVAREWLS